MSLILGFICMGFIFLWIEERKQKEILKDQIKIEQQYSAKLELILKSKLEELDQI